MTGFGKVTAELPSKKVTVEIKALNSKQLDLSTRIPSIYKEKEMQIRSLLLQSLERGKVEFNIFVEYIGKDTPTQINLAAVENYYNQIKDIADRLNIGLPADWFQTLLRMPDVIKTEAQEVNEEEWNVVEKAIKEAIGHLCDFRIQEGAMLQKLFEQKIANISRRLSEVEPYEKERIEKIKARIMDNLEKIAGQDYDKNRFEQEMIYYIEKLDETIQTMDYKFNTGNAVTDVIINNKYQKAENAGISFQVKFNLGETDTISAFDIGIILNNLLDNAIEACEKLEQEQRYINLTLKKKNHFLLIEVENSFDGKVIWEDGGIVPMTTKQSDLPDILMEHGIGLKNVKNVADHYLGDMDIKIKNDVFKVTVMLQQKEIK